QIEARAADGVALPPLRARLAIVTVPLGVLQAPAGATGAIRFDPPLPHATRAAIQALAFGAVTKVVIRFNRVPWRKPGPRGLGFLHIARGAFPSLWTWSEGPRPVVVAWAAGTAAERLRAHDPSALRRVALATLAGALARPLGEL